MSNYIFKDGDTIREVGKNKISKGQSFVFHSSLVNNKGEIHFEKGVVYLNEVNFELVKSSDGHKLNTNSSYSKGVLRISPLHPMVSNMAFEDATKSEVYNEKEANLADAIARVAEENGMSNNDIFQLFPAILRMLKSDSRWAIGTK